MRGWPLVGRAEELRVIEEGTAASGGVGAHEAGVLVTAMGWMVRRVVGTVASRSVPMGAFPEWTDGLDGNPLRLVATGGYPGTRHQPSHRR